MIKIKYREQEGWFITDQEKKQIEEILPLEPCGDDCK